MPDTRDMDAFVARITAGADSDEERRRRIEAFARLLQSAQGAGQAVASVPVLSAQRGSGAPLVVIAREPVRASQPEQTQLAPSPTNLAPDAVTERVPGAGYDTPLQTAMIVPQGASRYDSITTDPRFREQRR